MSLSIKPRDRLLTLALFIIVWAVIASFANNPLVLPGPWTTATSGFPSLSVFGGGDEGEYLGALVVLLHHGATTVWRVIVGVSAGIILGMMVGLILSVRGRIPFVSDPFLTGLRSVPLFALIPLFSFWFGGSELSIIGYIIFAVGVVVSSDVLAKTSHIPVRYVQQCDLFGASQFFYYRRIVLPYLLPRLFGTIRVVVGLSWAFALGAEFLSDKGIGHLVFQSYLYADMGKLMALAAIYLALGGALFGVTHWVTTTVQKEQSNQYNP